MSSCLCSRTLCNAHKAAQPTGVFVMHTKANNLHYPTQIDWGSVPSPDAAYACSLQVSHGLVVPFLFVRLFPSSFL